VRLIIVSGLSGSGKSVALHQLEDIDFYCVDNIPAALLKPFISHTIRARRSLSAHRGGLGRPHRPNEIDTIPALVGELRRSGIGCEVLFLHASDEVLLKRYAETRRKHPLVSGDVSLREASHPNASSWSRSSPRRTSPSTPQGWACMRCAS